MSNFALHLTVRFNIAKTCLSACNSSNHLNYDRAAGQQDRCLASFRLPLMCESEERTLDNSFKFPTIEEKRLVGSRLSKCSFNSPLWRSVIFYAFMLAVLKDRT